MEIPLTSAISGFEAGINSLQNPNFLSRLFRLAGIGDVFEFYSFWTWGALILAFIATFSSVINRAKFVICRLQKGKTVISEPLLRFVHGDDEEDEDYETCSMYSEDDRDEDQSFSQSNLLRNENSMVYEDFRVLGSGNYREEQDQGQNGQMKLRRSPSFSWSDFGRGGSVVDLWDGFRFENSGGFISVWDLNRGEAIRSFFAGTGHIPARCLTSPVAVLSAGVDNGRIAALRVWDARVGGQIPAAVAEWQPSGKRVVGVFSGGVEKVYVRDDVSSIEVRDLRNMKTPLVELTESKGETWWDADAVIVGNGDEGFDGSVGANRVSVVSWCRNAVRSYLF